MGWPGAEGRAWFNWVAGGAAAGPGSDGSVLCAFGVDPPRLMLPRLLACPSNHLSAMRTSPLAYGTSALFFLLLLPAPPMTCYGLTRPWLSRSMWLLHLRSVAGGMAWQWILEFHHHHHTPVPHHHHGHHPLPLHAASRPSCFCLHPLRGARCLIRDKAQRDAVQHPPQNMQPQEPTTMIWVASTFNIRHSTLAAGLANAPCRGEWQSAIGNRQSTANPIVVDGSPNCCSLPARRGLSRVRHC